MCTSKKKPMHLRHVALPGGRVHDCCVLSHTAKHACCCLPGFVLLAVYWVQIQFYNFAAPGFAENTGHFSALVWKDTNRIGCAANLRCRFKTWICQFTPAGEWLGTGKQVCSPQRTITLLFAAHVLQCVPGWRSGAAPATRGLFWPGSCWFA